MLWSRSQVYYALRFQKGLPVTMLAIIFQSITMTDFQVCLKDIQRYDAHHDPITLNYMAAGCKYAALEVLVSDLQSRF